MRRVLLCLLFLFVIQLCIQHISGRLLASNPSLAEVLAENVKDSESITYREFLLDDLKKKYTDVPISGYLEPERLKEIFGI
jgi:hypothetical protein